MLINTRHVDELECRLKELERLLKTSNGSSSADLARLPLPNGNHLPRRVSRSSSKAVLDTEVSLNDAESSSGTEYDAPAIDERTDFTRASQMHNSENAFGGSETLHFAMSVEASVAQTPSLQRKSQTPALHQLTSTPDIPFNPWQKGDPRRKDALPESQFRADRQRISIDYIPIQSQSLPKYPVAERLFDLYFGIVNPIWPFLVEDQCRDLFKSTWESPKQLDPLWIAQLHLIFCLSCQSYNNKIDTTRPLDDSPGPGHDFYIRAREIIVSHSLDVVSVSMLQALLLMALYQQNTLRSRQCYLTVGHATRVAQELGLHVPLPEGQGSSSLDKELRLRLWWGCFSLDR